MSSKNGLTDSTCWCIAHCLDGQASLGLLDEVDLAQLGVPFGAEGMNWNSKGIWVFH